MEIIKRRNLKPFITKDKLELREFYRCANVNMAEAIVGIGKTTKYHYHKRSMEFYYILEGYGMVEIEGEEKEVSKDLLIIIPRMKKHQIRNIGKEPLKFLCFRAPPYDDNKDTVLVNVHKRNDFIVRYVPKKKMLRLI